MEAWILAVILERGTKPQVHSAHRTERSCVAAGEAWDREMSELRKRLHKPRPVGWLCTTAEETPS